MPVFLRDLEATPCCRDASMKDPLRGASNQSAALTHSYRCTCDALKRDKLTRRKTDYMWSVSGRPLSADVRFGSKRTCAVQKGMSALHPKADMCSAPADVCFGPKADIPANRSAAFKFRRRVQRAYRFRCEVPRNRWAWLEALRPHPPGPCAWSRRRHKR